MSFFKNLGKGLTKGLKSGLGKTLIGVAGAALAPMTGGASAAAAALAIKGISEMGNDKVKSMASAIAQTGIIDQQKVAENLQKVGVTATPEVVNATTHALKAVVADQHKMVPKVGTVTVNTGTGAITITNEALTERLKRYFAIVKLHVITYKWWYLTGGLLAAVGIVWYFSTKKRGGRRRRR